MSYQYFTPVHRLITCLACFGLILFAAACNTVLPNLPEGTEAASTAESTPPGSALQTATAAVTPSPAATRTPTPVIRVQAAELRGQTVRFWHAWNNAAEQEVQKLMAEFNASNKWGIQVESSSAGSPDELDEKVSASLYGTEPPDLVTAFPYQAQLWEERVAHPVLVALDDYVQDSTWGLSAADQSDFFPAFWAQDLDSAGRRFGIPAQRSGQVLLYNQTWAKELGFDQPPDSPEAFKEQACAAAQAVQKEQAKASGQKTGGYILSTHYSTLLGWIYAHNGQVKDSEAKSYRFDADEVRATFTFLRQLYDDGCAWLPAEGQAEAAFASRQGLFVSTSLVSFPTYVREFRRAFNRDTWTTLPYPASQQPALDVYGPSFVILSSTPERQLASWLVLQWLVAPINQARLTSATGTFPTRASVLQALSPVMSSQWNAAAAALSHAQAEPALKSWGMVRWALSDAGIQLFRSYFSVDQVPSLTQLLDSTAADLNKGAPTPAPPPPTATRRPTVDPAAKPPTRTPRPSATASPTRARTTAVGQATVTGPAENRTPTH